MTNIHPVSSGHVKVYEIIETLGNKDIRNLHVLQQQSMLSACAACSANAHFEFWDICVMSTSPFGKTNQTYERNGKLTIYIIETTKKLAKWPE